MSGPQCCENPPSLSPSSGVGSVIELGGLKCYACGPSDSKLAIILIADVYGYEAPNLRKIADKVAAAGFHVVVPDFFYGEPYNPVNAEKPIQVWKAEHEPAKAFEDSKPVIEALRSKGISAIGAAGFCYGGGCRTCECGLIEAGVFLHPSFVTLDDIKEVKVPLAILGAEIDNLSPPEVVKQFEEVLSSKTELCEDIRWCVRYNVEDEKAVKAAEESREDMLNWFIKYVK